MKDVTNKDWLEKEVTINRDTFTRILAEQTYELLETAKECKFSDDYMALLFTSITAFGASVAHEIFSDKKDELEVNEK